MTHYTILFCSVCENKVELSVKGEAWCCGDKMVKTGVMEDG